MIRLISGSTRIGSAVFTPESGAFSADREIEERLVVLKAAVFVNKMSGEKEKTPSEDIRDSKLNSGTADNENDPEHVSEGDTETFEEPYDAPEENPDYVYDLSYDANSSVSDLRKVGKAVGLTFAVGTTKADMIAALDEAFAKEQAGDEHSLDIAAEEPVE